VIFGERHLRHVLLSYMDYYNGTLHSLVIEKGRADITRRRDSRTHYLPSDPGRTAPSIWPDLIYGRHTGSIKAKSRRRPVLLSALFPNWKRRSISHQPINVGAKY
jgi:hypothetical protein